MLQLGVEQEFVFAGPDGQYLDADTADYPLFRRIVDAIPAHEGDDAFLACKSLETSPKRCYVEGFERHDGHGWPVETLPKGLEIRTLPHDSIRGVIDEFRVTFGQVMSEARRHGLEPLLTSHHPFKSAIAGLGCLEPVELESRTKVEFDVARRSMLTHGIHVSVSSDAWAEEDLADLVAKINYYLPVIITWSFSSPFQHGQLFEGLCSRNYTRARRRQMTGTLQRIGCKVIEFRGFDTAGSHELFKALLSLFAGLVIDRDLAGRAKEQNADKIQASCLFGFSDAALKEECQHVLEAAYSALGGHEREFELLQNMLDANETYASHLKQRYAECGSIMQAMKGQFDYQ